MEDGGRGGAAALFTWIGAVLVRDDERVLRRDLSMFICWAAADIFVVDR